MKLVELGSFGDQGLSFVERGQPSPCLGEVVVKIKAASINNIWYSVSLPL